MNIGVLLLMVSTVFSIINLFNLNSNPNHMIGYRTKRSISSFENWHLAQNIFFPVSIIFLLILIILYKNDVFSSNVYLILCLTSYIISAIITEFILYKK